LFDRSEEGGIKGLGLLQGGVRRFAQHAMVDANGKKLKVPHMGWNGVYQTLSHPLWEGIPSGARFYFVHSYFPEPDEPGIVAGYSVYPASFACAVGIRNIFAVQFHPEKSHSAGLRLLSNFVVWRPGTVAAENPARAAGAMS